jgi:outer membrane protein TolC
LKTSNTVRQAAPMLAVALFAMATSPSHAGSPSAERNTLSSRVTTIDLPTVLRLAGAQSLDIRIAREKFAEARANEASAIESFFPWLAVGGAYRRHDNLTQAVEGPIIDVSKESYNAGPVLAAQVDVGDSIYKMLAAQRLSKAANFGVESQRQDTVLAAAQAYFDLATAQGSVGAAREALGIARDYAGQLRTAVEAGVAFKGDELRARVQAAKNEVAFLQTQEAQRVASARLVEILHLRPMQLAAADTAPVALDLVQNTASLDSLLAQALGNRPELHQSQAQAAAARAAEKGAIYGPLVPSVGAQAFVGGFGGGVRGGDHRAGESEDYLVTVGWRIGPGGLFDFGRIRAAQARTKIADLNLQKLSDQITRQVTEALVHVQSLAAQLKTLRRAVNEAQETLRLTRERKEFAIGAVLETIQSEQDLTQTRLDYISAVGEYNKAQYALRKAIGEPRVPESHEAVKPTLRRKGGREAVMKGSQ